MKAPTFTYLRSSSPYVYQIEARADTKEALEIAINEYCENRYPTPGYDSRFREPKQDQDGTWVAYGSRLASCD